MTARLRVSLVKCGTCGKRYSNPLTHVCAPRTSRKHGRTRVTPQVSLTCPRCGKPYANQLTHVCKTRTDFRRRKKAAAKAARRDREQHDYASCGDEDCERFPCKVYREGRARGFEEGEAVGFQAGQAAGAAAAKG